MQVRAAEGAGFEPATDYADDLPRFKNTQVRGGFPQETAGEWERLKAAKCVYVHAPSIPSDAPATLVS